MKRVYLTLIISYCFVTCFAQLNQHKLSDNYNITYKDLLEIKLQILSTQMTCGNYIILDMGTLGYPVSIYFDNDNKIIFKITKNIDQNLSRDLKKNIMEEGFNFVKTGISELIRTEFKGLIFDLNKDLLGLWHLANDPTPIAKWENGKFIWAKEIN
jgi:hypothetical protein